MLSLRNPQFEKCLLVAQHIAAIAAIAAEQPGASSLFLYGSFYSLCECNLARDHPLASRSAASTAQSCICPSVGIAAASIAEGCKRNAIHAHAREHGVSHQG
eukprot:TRINITY_DN8140_c0_g4_i4.p1 TRINITY_DN8140_c0_g4~~TRINITY_DN8140_c0_g4_i4.p1  ORF type:complete len:102 (+),score=2.08 TRINITY_DN8140_c0_g4_i4:65-370(+)